jgi:hypothetical protein
MKKTIQLRAAKIPGIIGYIAVHYWFVIITEKQKDRWEIWQNPHRSSQSWGHLHKNLMHYENGVGNGASWLEQEWNDYTALQIAEIIENSPQTYQYNYYYRYYPGPNSNTYIQWVLNQAKIDYDLSNKGIGKNFHEQQWLSKTVGNFAHLILQKLL